MDNLEKYKASTFYWRYTPKPFADFYDRTKNLVSPTRLVTSFLADRTNVLLSMTKPVKNGVLLDVGCGSGVHLKQLAPRFKKIVGVDYSQPMLQIAKETLKRVPKTKWKLVEADAAKLPFKSKEFDAIVAMGLLDYVPSAKKVLTEFRRVIKPGGYIVVSMPKDPSVFGFLRTSWGIRIKNIVFKLPRIDNTVNLNQLLKLLEETGFSLQEVTHIWDAMWMIRAKSV